MTIVQVRRGTTTEWDTANPVLASGEMGYDTTTNQVKMGNGSTSWTNLVPLATQTNVDLANSDSYKAYIQADPITAYPIGITQFLGEGSGVGLWRPWPGVATSFVSITTIRDKTYTGGSWQIATHYTDDSVPPAYRIWESNATDWGTWQTFATQEYVDSKVVGARGYISATDYGAKGDGVTDDAQAIRNAVNAAAPFGADVQLDSGKTYFVNSALVFTDTNVRLVCRGKSAVIQAAAGQTFDILTAQATTDNAATTKTLAASITINTNGWVLNNTTGLTVGMLCAVISSKPWYYDPRTDSSDARKSELHRVTAISGNTVWFEDAANDGYDIASETVQLYFYKPIDVFMENIVVRGVQPAYAATTPWKDGIVVKGAYEPLLINVDVEQAAYTGISLRWSYLAKVIGGHTHSANAVPTGYGVSIDGGAHNSVFNRSFWECRRAVDFSGGNLISRYNLVENCIQMGGGRQSDGQYYGWGPNNSVGIQNYGFGTHGPADHTTYRNNRTANCQIPYELRGGDEVIDGAYHIGRTRGGFINLLFGSGFEARNIKVIAAHTGHAKNVTVYDGGANNNTRRADYFVNIAASYDFVNSRINIENIDAEVQDRFVSMESGALPQLWFRMANIRVLFATSSGTTPVAVLYHDGPLTSASYRWTIGPIDYRRDTGTGPVTLTTNVNLNNTKLLEYGLSGATT